MIEKTVGHIVRKKMEDWLTTLPSDLVEDVKANILVSGGCIASLFRSEDVNDYDVYFKDIDVLLRLIEFYEKEYGIPEALDGRKKYQYIAENLKERGFNFTPEEYLDCHQYEIFGEYGDGSGEFVRFANLSDERVRMAVSSTGMEMNYDNPKEEPIPVEKLPKYRPVFISPNAISLSDDIQIVTRFTGDAQQIHRNYDFVHATNYFDFKDGLVLNLEAMVCLRTSELRYQGSRYPLTSILRMKKFIGRGWKINAGETLKIMFQISSLDLNDPNVLEEQLIGIDVAYFSRLIAIIRGMYNKEQSFELTQDWLWDIINKVFNSYEDWDEEGEIN